MTLNFNPRRATVVTYSHPKNIKGQRSLSSNDRAERDGQTDTTDRITLPVLTVAVTELVILRCLLRVRCKWRKNVHSVANPRIEDG